MRFLTLFIGLTVGAFAAAFSVTDPYGQPQCATGVTVGCDVAGPPSAFDFKMADVNIGATSTTIAVYMDFGSPGATDLAPFALTPFTTISVADIFLYAPGGLIYAIPLYNRTTSLGSATAGTVYLANSAGALLNSEVVLNNPLDIDYRSGYAVWINTVQSTVASVGVVNLSSGASQGTEWLATVNFSYSAGSALANALSAPGVSFYTATATGANDIATGPDQAVPEPSPWTMVFSGLGFALFAARRRHKS